MVKIKHQKLEEFAIRHYQSIKEYLDKKYPGTVDAQNDRFKQYFGSNYSFEKIILASPTEMEELVRIWNTIKEDERTKDFDCYKELYIKFSSQKSLKDAKKKTYNALRLTEDLGIRVCPYCNRNFTFNTAKKGRRTCQMDHFFPKGNFPFLALSFYNLIPVCGWCNFVKKDKCNTEDSNMTLNPYDERFEFDAKIFVKITDSKFYYDANSIEINFDTTSSNERTQNHIKAFRLEELYKRHDDYVLELIQKKYAYSESYIDSLFQQYEGTLFKNREDILRFITSNYVEEADLSKRPLAKLTKDITEQLDL